MSYRYSELIRKARESAGWKEKPGRQIGGRTHREAGWKEKPGQIRGRTHRGEKGEGSKGGNVIGHTPSGKAIYGPSGGMSGAYAGHKKKGDLGSAKKWGSHAAEHIQRHKGYSKEDHEAAAEAHMKTAKEKHKAGETHEAQHHAKISALHSRRSFKSSQDVDLKKGKAYPIGTVRTHGGVKKKKTAQGWVAVEPTKKKKKKKKSSAKKKTSPKKVDIKNDASPSGASITIAEAGNVRDFLSNLEDIFLEEAAALYNSKRGEQSDEQRQYSRYSQEASDLSRKTDFSEKEARLIADMANEAVYILSEIQSGEDKHRGASRDQEKDDAVSEMRRVASEIEDKLGKKIQKGRKFPVGTIRTHGGVKKKKTASGWVPVEPSTKRKDSTKKKPDPKKKVAKLVQQLKVLTDEQKKKGRDKALLATVDVPSRWQAAYDAALVAGYHSGDMGAVRKLYKRAQELLPGIRTQDSIDVVAVAAENDGKLPKEFVDQMIRENRVYGEKNKRKIHWPGGEEPSYVEAMSATYPGTTKKASTETPDMKKGKTYPIGTVRTHGGVKKKKTARGWVPVEPSKKKKKAPAKKKKTTAKRKGASLAEKIKKTAQEMLEPGKSEDYHDDKESYHRHKVGDIEWDSTKQAYPPSHDYHSSMMMYHDSLSNAKNYLRAAQDESLDQADMLKEAKSYLRLAKNMKKYAEEGKAQMGKSQIQRLTMKKTITLYDAVQIAKAIGRVTGDASLETAGGKGTSLEDAESFSIPKDDEKKKKKKKKKKRKKWKVPGEVPA